MTILRFNIRVYGLLIDGQRILVADELIRGQRITKFPGGGLELGEGPKDGLIREIREELGIEAFDVEHYYTTDFYQPSAFREGEQIISIYFTFRVADVAAIRVSTAPFDFEQVKEGAESFRWLDLPSAREEDMTLPIDRVVVRMLLRR